MLMRVGRSLDTGKSGTPLTAFHLQIFNILPNFRFDRRFRIYDISDYGETIRTWKRTENDQVIDEMVLSGAGAPPP